jgi:hypothetical protein
MKNIKETAILVNLAKQFGQDVDTKDLEKVNNYVQIQTNIKESVKTNAIKDLAEAFSGLKIEKKKPIEYPKPPSLEDLQTIMETSDDVDTTQEQFVEQQVTPEQDEPEKESDRPKSLAELAAESISTATHLEGFFNNPEPAEINPEFKAVTQKLKYLEQWISKISMHGPGGGAGSVARLDHETKLINFPTYSITTKDFYLGVNYAGNVTITMPSIANNGRMYVIKDESGNCSSNPITVLGNVDNDPGGFILQQNNGGIQMIYRDGWRIV